jgi:hypothetical protein
MKKEEFDHLEISDRSNIVWENGDYIAIREEQNYLVGLYVLNGFFVEVFYRFGRDISEVHSITEEQIIDLYMQEVDFSPLFN